MERFVFDPYIIQAVSSVSAEQVDAHFSKLYPDLVSADQEDRIEDLKQIARWLTKLRTKPGSALSTGGRNSDRGMFTCSLLAVLGVLQPKAVRHRMGMAWAIMDSPIGILNIGDAPELKVQRRRSNEQENRPDPETIG